jgi:hypothetical protein
MAAEQDQSPRKLVYLRDRTPRPKARLPRADRRVPSPPAGDLIGEATWLGRALFVVAGGMVAYWLLAVVGAIRVGSEGGVWRSLATSSLAHLFLTGTCGFAAVTLLRDTVRSSVPVAAAASALVLVTLESLGRLLVSGDLAEVSLSVRTQILASAGGLAVGVWALSYSIRLQRRDRHS